MLLIGIILIIIVLIIAAVNIYLQQRARALCKIIMLGQDAVGKTVFLASMYSQLKSQSPETGFSLTLDEDVPEQKAVLDGYQKELTLTNTEWPRPTQLNDNIKEWKFICAVRGGNLDKGKRLRTYHIMRFIYYDYAGERVKLLYDPKNTLNKKYTPAFRKILKKADIIWVALDGQTILESLQEDNNSFFDNFEQYLLPILEKSTQSVHFIITKWDLFQKQRIANLQEGKSEIQIKSEEKHDISNSYADKVRVKDEREYSLIQRLISYLIPSILWQGKSEMQIKSEEKHDISNSYADKMHVKDEKEYSLEEVLNHIMKKSKAFKNFIHVQREFGSLRIIPISSCGPYFAELDSTKKMIKKKDGIFRPFHVEMPVAGAIYDRLEYKSKRSKASHRKRSVTRLLMILLISILIVVVASLTVSVGPVVIGGIAASITAVADLINKIAAKNSIPQSVSSQNDEEAGRPQADSKVYNKQDAVNQVFDHSRRLLQKLEERYHESNLTKYLEKGNSHDN